MGRRGDGSLGEFFLEHEARSLAESKDGAQLRGWF